MNRMEDDDLPPPLNSAERRCVEAAKRWLALGNLTEAHGELDKIPLRSAGAHHPDVLKVRYRIFQAAQKWDDCLHVAEMLTDVEALRVSNWTLKVKALDALGRNAEAYEIALRVAGRFSEVQELTYLLARVCCQLGRMAEAKTWLEKTFAGENADIWKRLALEDETLKPFWDQL